MKRIFDVLVILLFAMQMATSVRASNDRDHEIGDNGFVAGSETDLPTSSQILFGTTGGQDNSTSEYRTLNTQNHYRMDRFSANTDYFFRVASIVHNGDSHSSGIGSTTNIPGQQTQPSQPTPTNTQAKLLFKSSFETSDVCSRRDSPPCNTPYHCGADPILKGGDPGYDWLSDFPTGGSDNFFNDVIGKFPDCCPNGCLSQSLSECHELDVVTTLDKNGQPTKALYWKLKKDCSQHSKSRVQFNMREPGEYNPVYFRYWVKFEDGWPQNTQGKWRQLWEFYYENNDWSNALVFNWRPQGPVWVLKGRYYGPDCCETQWKKASKKQIPKGGEWFLVETYLYSHYTDGQIIVKINGEEIFNHQGRTNRRPGQKPATAAMFKTYGDGWGHFEQWIDDFEMWTADPGYADGPSATPDLPR